MSSEKEDRAGPSRRIDRWLWCARRFRTRTLAARFVSEGGVRVTRAGATQRIDRPSFALAAGDQVSYLLGERLVVLTVLGFADRRGPPAAAKLLFTTDEIPRDQAGPNAAPACKADG